MNLPPLFISNIHHTFGEQGEAFLAKLPKLIDVASKQWDLTDVKPVPDLVSEAEKILFLPVNWHSGECSNG